MEIACSTSAFQIPLPDALQKIASLGFQCADLIAIGGWPHVDLPALAADFSREADRVETALAASGLRAAGLNFAVHTPHDRSDPVLNRARLEQTRAACRLMRRLGIPRAAYYPGYKAEARPWNDVLRDAVATYREMAAVAGEEGTLIAPEPHVQTPFQTIEQTLRLLDAGPDLRIVLDVSHYAFQDIPVTNLAPLFTAAIRMHARSAKPGALQCPIAESSTDFPALVSMLLASGFDGGCAIEYLPAAPFDLDREILALRDLLSIDVLSVGKYLF